MFKIKIYDKNLLKKERKILRKAVKAGDESVETLAELGKTQARYLAPQYTGDIKGHIRIIWGKDSQGKTAKISVEGFKAERAFGPGKYQDFDLVRWMHSTNGIFQTNNPMGRAGTKHIKTGNPQFMYRTRGYLNNIKTKIAQSKFNKINIR